MRVDEILFDVQWGKNQIVRVARDSSDPWHGGYHALMTNCSAGELGQFVEEIGFSVWEVIRPHVIHLVPCPALMVRVGVGFSSDKSPYIMGRHWACEKSIALEVPISATESEILSMAEVVDFSAKFYREKAEAEAEAEREQMEQEAALEALELQNQEQITHLMTGAVFVRLEGSYLFFAKDGVEFSVYAKSVNGIDPTPVASAHAEAYYNEY